MFATAPIAGAADDQGRPRLMLMAGFLFFAIGTWWMTYIPRTGLLGAVLAADLFAHRLMIAFIPINNISLATLPPERVKNASGLYNLTRNLAGRSASPSHDHPERSHRSHLARLHER